MKLKSLLLGMSVVLLSVCAPMSFAQSDVAAKKSAVERYLRAVPMNKMMEDTYAELAKQVPAEKRDEFITEMRGLIKIEKMEKIASDAMIKTFSVEELNALADFYSSKHGASAMKKFGIYMGEVMPPLMREIERAAKEVEARRK